MNRADSSLCFVTCSSRHQDRTELGEVVQASCKGKRTLCLLCYHHTTCPQVSGKLMGVYFLYSLALELHIRLFLYMLLLLAGALPDIFWQSVLLITKGDPVFAVRASNVWQQNTRAEARQISSIF